MMNLQLEKDKMLLAVQAAAAFTQTHGLAYAQISPDLTLQVVSDSFYPLLCLPTAVVGQKLTELFWQFAGLEETLDDILQGKLPHYRIEHFNHTCTNDATLFLDIWITPLDPQNPQRGLLLLLEDVNHIGRLRQTIVQERNELRLTQDKLTAANQELHRLNRQKSLVLSVIAHDLRGPLAVIHGMASLLQMERPGKPMPQKAEYLQGIILQANRLDQMISDLLDIDRLEQGTIALDTNPILLNTIIKEVIESLTFGLKNKRTNIEQQLPDEPIVIEADAGRLWRVIYNIIHNAIKYSPKNGHVVVQLAQTADNEIKLTVQDDGIGMTAEEMSNLFHLYYRTDDAQKRGIKGTGLGLFIVKSIVEAHGGRVEVVSQPNVGSTFALYLPITQTKSGL